MAKQQALRLRAMEGTRVSVELRDGSRIGGCLLVSSGRKLVGSLWLYTDGTDMFVALSDVADVWQADRLDVLAA